MKHKAGDGKGVRFVFLNEVAVDRVVEADDELGYVIRHTGEIANGEFVTERLEGKVEVVFTDGNR